MTLFGSCSIGGVAVRTTTKSGRPALVNLDEEPLFADVPESDGDPLCCKYCGKQFERKQALGSHHIHCASNPTSSAVVSFLSIACISQAWHQHCAFVGLFGVFWLVNDITFDKIVVLCQKFDLALALFAAGLLASSHLACVAPLLALLAFSALSCVYVVD